MTKVQYITIPELVARCGAAEINGLAIDDNGDYQPQMVEDAIADASARINSYIAPRHALPLSVIPDSLKRTCCQIARYFLYKGAKDDLLKADYDDAISYLKDIAKGSARLEVSETGASPQPADEVIYVESSPRLFSHSQMEGF